MLHSFHPAFHNSKSKVQGEMLAYMHQWVQGLKNQHDVLRRLTKQAVRNHENIRQAGEGGPPETHGSYAHTQGIQMQHNIESYVSSVPIIGQAQHFLGQSSGGPSREMLVGQKPGANPTPAAHTYSSPGLPPPPPPLSGEAASFYSPPPGSAPGSSSTFSPPSGPPPSFPDAPGGYASPGGYPPPAGGYAPNYSSPGPSFPEYHPTGGYDGGYTPPPGGPGFPGPAPYGAPPGPPPGFPPPPGPPGQGGYPPPGSYNQPYGGGRW
jgi:hypothetical protein